jgi:hypothetical protein
VTDERFLRDVIDIPESVHAGDFKVELSGGFVETKALVDDYVVTDQLLQAFRKALSVVRAAVRGGGSHAAYLHGSFGSGKSHFMAVLHAVLDNDEAARSKADLQPVIAEHDEWLVGKRFLKVPYHLVGAADVASALLGGYVATVRRLHPDRPTPAVYRADAMLTDARGMRAAMGDDVRFAEWLGVGPAQSVGDADDLDVIEGDAAEGWDTATLDRAFAAPAGDVVRDALVSALLSGPMSSYARGASGDSGAFLPLEDGLAVISRHARDLGYDGLVLFLDELILWLQAHMSDQQFVNDQVSQLVKLIESGVAERALPIVSFISRQRDLSKLVGEDVTGADVKNLEAQVEYLAARFDVVTLEDRNLPDIVLKRVLKRRPGGDEALAEAFATVESANAVVRDVLLDQGGATGADWADFRKVYPLSPALLNVLVALSGALQRERTGLKLLQEMLQRRRADMRLGELLPLGDLWDVLIDGTGEAFTDRLRREAEAAQRFYTRVRQHLLDKYGGAGDSRFVADDRFIKTLLLAFLTPNVSALARLTGGRLAALNHGSIRSRTVAPGTMVVNRLRELQAEFGELRGEGDVDPVFSLHLSDLDVEPLLDQVGEVDTAAQRRIWVKDQLWRHLEIRDNGEFVSEREVVWRGTRRTVEVVFENVRDPQRLPDPQFEPSLAGRVRLVIDYPFDEINQYPTNDAARVRQLHRDGLEAATVVWLPHFFSTRRSGQLGRLLKIDYLLARDRLDDYAAHLSADDRLRVRHQLQAQRDTLESQLDSALRQVYGIAQADEATVGAVVGEDGHVMSLRPGHRPRLYGGAGFLYNLMALADGMFAALYPKHPDFDTTNNRRPVSLSELRTALRWITEAAENGNRVELDRTQLPTVKKIVHPLELGDVHDGPLVLSNGWRLRIERQAASHGATGDFAVGDLRSWLNEMGYTGLDAPVANLIIASYALLANRAWVLRGQPEEPPGLDRIDPGWALRAQPMPGEAVFAVARDRSRLLLEAAPVPSALVARNVHRLAEQVRLQVGTFQEAVHQVRRSLNDHAGSLDLTDDSDRRRSVLAGEDLLARLSDAADDAALVRALAGAEYAGISDQELSSAITAAPVVQAALDGVDWPLLDRVRGLTDSAGPVRDRAKALVDEVTRAARAHEFRVRLAPVLTDLRSRAVDLIIAMAPTSIETATTNEETSGPTDRADDVDLNRGGTPRVPVDTPATRRPPASRPRQGVRRVPAGDAGALAEAIAELRAFSSANPDTAIEISWRPAEDGPR